MKATYLNCALLPAFLLVAVGHSIGVEEIFPYDLENGVPLPREGAIPEYKRDIGSLPPPFNDLAAALAETLRDSTHQITPAITAMALLGPDALPFVFEALRRPALGITVAVEEGLRPLGMWHNMAGSISSGTSEERAYVVPQLAAINRTLAPVFAKAATEDIALVRMVAIYHLGRLGIPLVDIEAPLGHALQDPVPEVRRAAASVIPTPRGPGWTYPAQEVPEQLLMLLGTCLEDTDARVREQAMDSLLRCGQQASIVRPAIERAATNTNEKVKWAALGSLELLQQASPEALQEQIEKYITGEGTWRAGFKAQLQRQHVETLVNGLQHTDAKAADHAAYLIYEYREQMRPYVDLLANHLASTPAKALDEILWTLREYPEETVQHLPALVAVGNSSRENREAVLAVLTRMGPAAAPAVPWLISQYQDSDAFFRLSVARTLGAVSAPNEEIVALLAGDCIPRRTNYSCGIAEVLGSLLQQEPALSSIAVEVFVQQLANLSPEEAFAQLQPNACTPLDYMSGTDVGDELLLRLLDRKSVPVSLAAARALIKGKVRPARVVKRLERLQRNEEQGPGRVLILESLALVGPDTEAHTQARICDKLLKELPRLQAQERHRVLYTVGNWPSLPIPQATLREYLGRLIRLDIDDQQDPMFYFGLYVNVDLLDGSSELGSMGRLIQLAGPAGIEAIIQAYPSAGKVQRVLLEVMAHLPAVSPEGEAFARRQQREHPEIVGRILANQGIQSTADSKALLDMVQRGNTNQIHAALNALEKFEEPLPAAIEVLDSVFDFGNGPPSVSNEVQSLANIAIVVLAKLGRSEPKTAEIIARTLRSNRQTQGWETRAALAYVIYAYQDGRLQVAE